MICIVCHTPVPADVDECPGCDEPTVRICRCSTVVTIDQLQCPTCGDVVPRFVAPAERRKRAWRTRFLVAGAIVLVAGGIAASRFPGFRAGNRRQELMESVAAELAAGRVERASEQLEEVVATGISDADSLRLEALVAFARGDGERGAQFAQSAIARATSSPAPAGLHLELARHFLAAGEPARAFASAQLAPEPAAVPIAARALAAMERYVEAAGAFGRAMSADPEDLEAALGAIDVHAELARADWPGSGPHREQADRIREAVAAAAAGRLGKSPGDAAAVRARALALAGLSTAPAAEVDSACERAIESGAGVRVRLAWAGRLVRDGRLGSVAAALGPQPGPGAPPAEQVERCRLLAHAKGAAAAERELRDILSRSPTDAGAALALARLQLDTDRASAALATIRNARVTGARYEGDLLACACDATLALGSPADAEKHLGAWLKSSPRDPRPLRRLLDLRMPEVLARIRAGVEADDRMHSAISRMEELALHDPSDRSLLYWRVREVDARLRSSEAAKDLAVLFARHPERSDVRELRIRRAVTGGSWQEATAIADELTSDPVPPPVSDLRTFATAALEAGRLALVLDVAALRRPAPPDRAFEDALCRALLALGRPAAAAAAPDASDASLRALALAMSGRASEAAAVCGPAPSRARQVAVARAICAAGLRDTAVSMLRAIDTFEAQAGPLADLASAFEEAGAYDDARGSWSAAEVVAPADPVLLVRWAVAVLVRPASDESDRVAIADRAETALERVAGSPDWLALRGIFLLSTNEPVAAEVELRRAILASPDRLEIRRALAIALRATGRSADAAVELREILRRDPAAADVRAEVAAATIDAAADRMAAGRPLSASALLAEAAARAGNRTDLGSALPPPLTDDASSWIGARADAVGAAAPIVLVAALDACARGDVARGLALADRAAKADPALASAPVVRAVILRASGEQDLAEAEIAAARRLSLAPEESAAATVLLTAGAVRPDEIAALRTAAEEYPDDARPAALLARALDRSGAADLALDELGRIASASLRPGVGVDYHGIGQRLAAAGRVVPARRALRRALMLDPADPAAPASRRALEALPR